MDLTNLNFLPKKKVSNWRELPVWLKFVLPGFGLVMILGGILMKSSFLKDISLIMLYATAILNYLHFTHESRIRTLRKGLIWGLVGGLIVALYIIYILTS